MMSNDALRKFVLWVGLPASVLYTLLGAVQLCLDSNGIPSGLPTVDANQSVAMDAPLLILSLLSFVLSILSSLSFIAICFVFYRLWKCVQDLKSYEQLPIKGLYSAPVAFWLQFVPVLNLFWNFITYGRVWDFAERLQEHRGLSGQWQSPRSYGTAYGWIIILGWIASGTWMFSVMLNIYQQLVELTDKAGESFLQEDPNILGKVFQSAIEQNTGLGLTMPVFALTSIALLVYLTDQAVKFMNLMDAHSVTTGPQN